jgi:hypothetical protein
MYIYTQFFYSGVIFCIPTQANSSQRHILRDRRPITTSQVPMPCLLDDGDKEIETVYGEGKIFCIGPTRSAKAGKAQ